MDQRVGLELARVEHRQDGAIVRRAQRKQDAVVLVRTSRFTDEHWLAEAKAARTELPAQPRIEIELDYVVAIACGGRAPDETLALAAAASIGNRGNSAGAFTEHLDLGTTVALQPYAFQARSQGRQSIDEALDPKRLQRCWRLDRLEHRALGHRRR